MRSSVESNFAVQMACLLDVIPALEGSARDWQVQVLVQESVRSHKEDTHERLSLWAVCWCWRMRLEEPVNECCWRSA